MSKSTLKGLKLV